MARTIDAETQLRHFGIEFQSYGKFLRIRCPYHDDNQPSCDVSQEKQNFKCRACQVGGSILTLLTKLSGKSAHEVLARLGASQDKPVEASLVLRYHERIWSAPQLLKELYKRGVSDATIKLYLLGEDEGRITIPVQNYEGIFTNVRKYLPGATDEAKTKNLKGRGRPQIYPFAQLRYNKILITGGEIKALAGIERLNQHDIGCVTITCGEGEWPIHLEDFFEGKHIWVGLDIDDVGKRAQEFRCARLSSIASWVGGVNWPLNKVKYPTGDLNNFVADEEGDLFKLLEETPEWVGITASTVTVAEDTTEPDSIAIREAMLSSMAMKRFKSNVSMTAVGQDSYFIPKTVMPKCDRSQEGCPKCPVFHSKADTAFAIPAESTSILAMMDSHEDKLPDEIREAIGVPACPSVVFETTERYKIHETRVQRAMNLTHQDSDKTAVPAILIDQEPELNETYEIVGRVVPHPKNQRCYAIISATKAVADALTGFKLTSPEDLLRFRPKAWSVEAIDEHLDPIYEELAKNVTFIYERKTMHQLIDLAYHSGLAIRVGEHVQKGVVEALILGDSGQGKSDTAMHLAKFYGLGEKVDCKNATIAGLLGGLEQIGGKWFVQWGIIPQHDRRIVTLEELKGIKPEVFARLTDTRSSGVAEIPKIVRRKAQARTRLIAISNARKNSVLSTYSYGVYALSELIGSPEDLRRFDACMVVDMRDIDSKVINQMPSPMPSTFTAEQCRKLILWCWTRNIDQIAVDKDTIAAIFDYANKLNAEFTDTVPILDRGSTKFKLLRLATALAGRTFSASEDSETMIVRACHVEWVTKFLRTEYSKPTHGYLELSKRTRKKETLTNEKEVRTQLLASASAGVLVENLLMSDLIEAQDICDWCGWDKDEAGILISKLVRNNALQRDGRAYKKTVGLSMVLRNMLEDPDQFKRPEHAKPANDF